MVPNKISIIIPTYNHLEDNLKPCIQSIIKTTKLEEVEVLIVANGCKDGTEEYVSSLGSPFKLVAFEEAIGYTRAINEGMKLADGEYILLINDDVIILDQMWIPFLRDPFYKDPLAGITGPVKFTFDCGGTQKACIAFWCCMFKSSLIDKIGYLDEIFSPGMGEDGDYSIKTELAGYKLIQVPLDTSSVFGKPLGSDFPIYHTGNGTFAECKDKDEIIKRNHKILEDRYSLKNLYTIYEQLHNHPSDVNGLFPVLREYASKCDRITEFGVRDFVSTYAFFAGLPKRMVSYDIYTSNNLKTAVEVAMQSGISFNFIEHNTLTTTIEETDLLFIDTWHAYKQLSQELKLHGNKARKYILMHDTYTFGVEDAKEEYDVEQGEDLYPDKKGLKLAITEFLAENPHWELEAEIADFNGLTILRRKPKFSIIIPTCSDDGLTLQTCLERISCYTDLSDKEIIIAANGCDPNTLNFLKDYQRFATVLVWPEKQGQILPVNEAIKIARGEFVVCIDDDSHLLFQEKDSWIKILHEPFTKSDIVGMTGVFVADYPYLGKALHNGCTMYKKEAWDKVNGFDPIYGFGYLCDTDISLSIKEVGYQIVEVGVGGTFPIYHPDSPVSTEEKRKDAMLMRKNRNILYSKHGKKPKYSIIVPTYNHLEDCLKPCLDSLVMHTNLEDVEVLVVANGCIDGTADYIDSLGHPFKLIWIDEGLGFTKATNIGIKEAVGDYIVLLNNDTILLDSYPKNTWIEMLVGPFLKDPQVGITGPLELFDNYAGQKVMIFFCVMIKREMFDLVGLLDESYSPGGGEDIDFSVKVKELGYTEVVVPDTEVKLTFTNIGGFPIYHKGEGTFTDEEFPEYSKRIIKENGMKNMLRYNKHIKLNLGSGGVEVPGYLSVDKFDNRALIIMDALDLELPENSVEELLCSHMFEHINPYRSHELLAKWCRILKPGGKLIMELPNIEELCKEFAGADKAGRYGILNCIYGSVNTKDHAVGEITAPHLFGWWPESMYDHLAGSGFVDIVFLPEQIPHPGPTPACNMRVEAKKPL